MSGELIARLILALGPVALEKIAILADAWSRDLTPEEVKALCSPAKKSYEQYEEEARKAVFPVVK